MNFSTYSTSYQVYLDSSYATNPSAKYYAGGSTLLGYLNQNLATKGWNHLASISSYSRESEFRGLYTYYMSVHPNGYGQTVADAILVTQYIN